MEKVILITGGTSGIGLNAAKCLAARGCRVYELSRRETGTDAAIHIRADVTDTEQVNRAVQEVLLPGCLLQRLRVQACGPLTEACGGPSRPCAGPASPLPLGH